MSLDPGVLYRDHATAVWRYARARVPTDADAEDVTSDVFTRALRTVEGYDPASGMPRAWLVGIARHAVADFWRRRRPEDPTASVPDRAGISSDDPVEAVERAATTEDVHRLLDGLREREREVVALRFGAELSSAEIGDALGISPTAARMLLHRAVTKLRGVMTDE
ncbi:MAG TPA: sigma-70 family RNA polymerase sigma factor [Acidimicrobiales bacterium]|jgi:RNA polymerase sigma factor (sigma-70 family)|nr:sigma-70 family RNA polymerase sigma factor [Acidimicrobiales bacterium]